MRSFIPWSYSSPSIPPPLEDGPVSLELQLLQGVGAGRNKKGKRPNSPHCYFSGQHLLAPLPLCVKCTNVASLLGAQWVPPDAFDSAVGGWLLDGL